MINVLYKIYPLLFVLKAYNLHTNKMESRKIEQINNNLWIRKDKIYLALSSSVLLYQYFGKFSPKY